MLTVLGAVRFERAYYYRSSCHGGQSLRDREQDIFDTEYSPGVRRMMAVPVVAGSDISVLYIQMDRTGVQSQRPETAGRLGKMQMSPRILAK